MMRNMTRHFSRAALAVHWPGMPNSLALEQLEVLAKEVMPQVQQAV
jgi:hypothetical protein